MFFHLSSLGLHFDTIIVWAFLMAFLLNAFFYFAEHRVDKSLLITSIVMFTSYFTSNHFIDLYLDDQNDFYYLKFFLYDVVTISALYLVHKIMKVKGTVALFYVYTGLLLNGIAQLAIHYDVIVLWNREYWWLWSVYSVGVNVIDFAMASVLIISIDFLGIQKLYGFVKVKLLESIVSKTQKSA